MKKLMLMLAVAIWSSSSFAYYNSQQGRWLSRDPIQEKDNANLYVLVHNNPINHTDLYGLETLSGVTVRRFIQGGGHQWLTFEQPLPQGAPPMYNSPLVHIGVNKSPDHSGAWINEEMNRPRNPFNGQSQLEDPSKYYEWEVVTVDTGKSASGTECKCMKQDDIKQCIGTTIIVESVIGTPDDFNIAFNNCRDNSERVLKGCCAKKGNLINNPNHSSGIGRWSRDWLIGPFRYIF